MKIEQVVRDKSVLFITTHRIDYIRNTQEIELLRHNAKSVKLLYTNADNHCIGAAKIFLTLLFSSLKNYDVVLVSYMCQLVVPLFNWKFRKKVLIVDFFISLYDALVFDRQKFRDRSLAAKFCHMLDNASVKNADLIIADTKAHATYFKNEFKIADDCMEVLYLQADSSIYYPKKIKKLDVWKEQFLVVYFGTVIPLQGFEIVLEAVERLKHEKGIHFLIIGPVTKLYEKSVTDNATYIDWVPQEKLAEYIAMSDLCLAGHFNNKIMKAQRTIPGKAYIYESMGKPMILGDSTANHELFAEDEYHQFVTLGDGNALAEKILEMRHSITERRIKI